MPGHNYKSTSQLSNSDKLYRLAILFGLVYQLSFNTDTVVQLLLPLRPLLSTKHEYVWLVEHDQGVKKHLIDIPILAFFNITKPTRLCTDASRQGVGFVLQQQSDTGQWTLVQPGSCFLTLAESRYVVIDLLAISYVVSDQCFYPVYNIFKLSPINPNIEHPLPR